MGVSQFRRFPNTSDCSSAPLPALNLPWAPPGAVRCWGLKWTKFTPAREQVWVTLPDAPWPLYWMSGSPSSILKSTFTLSWSKHHRARKGLGSTKATLLFNGKGLFWELFMYLWISSGSSISELTLWLLGTQENGRNVRLRFIRPFNSMASGWGPVWAAASSSIK